MGTTYLRRYKVRGIACLCHPECISGYRADRQHGLIYGPYKVDGKIMGVDEASIAASFCAYCGINGDEPQNYDARVRAYEAKGLTRSDAQGVVDAELLKEQRSRA